MITKSTEYQVTTTSPATTPGDWTAVIVLSIVFLIALLICGSITVVGLAEVNNEIDLDPFEPFPYPTIRLYVCLDGTRPMWQSAKFVGHVGDSVSRSLGRFGLDVEHIFELGMQRTLDIASLQDAMIGPEEDVMEVLGHFIVRLEVPAGDEYLLHELKGFKGVFAVDEDLDVVMGICSDNAR